MNGHAFLILSVIMLTASPFSATSSVGAELSEGSWRRDPFYYSDEPGRRVGAIINVEDKTAPEKQKLGEKRKGLQLKGIVAAGDGRYRALVNDREVGEGERVEGVRIVRIQRFAIEVEEQDGTRMIDLFDNQMKWGDQ